MSVNRFQQSKVKLSNEPHNMFLFFCFFVSTVNSFIKIYLATTKLPLNFRAIMTRRPSFKLSIESVEKMLVSQIASCRWALVGQSVNELVRMFWFCCLPVYLTNYECSLKRLYFACSLALTTTFWLCSSYIILISVSNALVGINIRFEYQPSTIALSKDCQLLQKADPNHIYSYPSFVNLVFDHVHLSVLLPIRLPI